MLYPLRVANYPGLSRNEGFLDVGLSVLELGKFLADEGEWVSLSPTLTVAVFLSFTPWQY